MKLYRFVLIAVFSLLPLALASCPPRIQANELMNPIFRNFVFEQVWQTVSDHYLYDDFGGLNWQEAKDEFRESSVSASNNAAFYLGVDDMIYALNDDHSVYLAPWESCEEDGWEAKPSPSDTESKEIFAPDLSVKRLELNPGVLFIQLSSFDSETLDEDFTLEIRNALREGEITSIILDLRQNYGGYLETTFNILEHFVHGNIGFEVDKEGQHPIISVKTPYYPKLAGTQLIVFVNSESHSAAELTAGILQLERSATIIGTASAGNTEIVMPFDFRDGSRLWLAVSSFRLRDGTNLEGRGVIPDILVKHNDDYLNAALSFLSSQATQNPIPRNYSR